MDDPRLVDAEFHLARFDLLHCLRDVDRHRPGLRVRHQAARAEHLSELADGAHHVGRRHDGVEVHETALDLLDHLLAADHVGAGRLGFLLLLAAGNREHPLALAEPVWQYDGAAHHLVGVLRVDAEPQRQVDRLVELRVLDFLHERDRFLDRVGASLGNRRPCSGELLPALSHVSPPVVQSRLRALPPHGI